MPASGKWFSLKYIVIILKSEAVFCFGKVTDKFFNQFLLLFCSRLMFPCVVYFLYALALCDIANEMLRVLSAASPEVSAFQNNFCHGYSSQFWNFTAPSKRTAPRRRFTSSTHSPRSRESVSVSISLVAAVTWSIMQSSTAILKSSVAMQGIKAALHGGDNNIRKALLIFLDWKIAAVKQNRSLYKFTGTFEVVGFIILL